MAYEARVFQILIASPGDVQDERKILADIIYEWNAVNSRERRVVLLPLRWETHSAPEMGSSPQVVINRQVVDQCDVAIGIFWTRLGTPTAEAESGTAEEIERVGNMGKHVMLYFSRAKVELDLIDVDEYMRLKDFKTKTFPQGLIENYSSLSEFREKLTRQLAIKLLAIIAEDSRNTIREEDTSPLYPIAMVLGDGQDVLTSPAVVNITKIVCTNPEEIPTLEEMTEERESHSIRIGVSDRSNPAYYREMVDYFIKKSSYKPLRLGVKSTSDQAVRDLYLEMRSEALNGKFELTQTQGPPGRPQKSSSIFFGDQFILDRFTTAGVLVFNSDPTGEKRMEMELPVAQRQRTILSTNEFIIDTNGSSATGIIHATVYSSDRTPFSIQTKVEILVTERQMSYQQILEEAEALPE